MSNEDEEFVRRLQATFQVEAEELLQSISSSLLELEKISPSAYPEPVIEKIYRDAHSLKGAARAVDLSAIESICQTLEGVFSIWKKNRPAPTAEDFDLLHRGLDLIRELIQSPASSDDIHAPLRTKELIHHLGELQSRAINSSQTPPLLSQQHPKSEIGIASVLTESDTGQSPSTSVQGPSFPAGNSEIPASVADTVRISLNKLDARLLQAEDMLTVKAITNQRAAELRRLTPLFDEWQKEWAKVSLNSRFFRPEINAGKLAVEEPSAMGHGEVLEFLGWNRDFIRSIENKLRSLSAAAEQDCHSVGRRTDDLLEDTKKLLMLPFSTMSNLLAKMVRDLSRDQNKDAELVIHGGDIEIDKRILEEIKDALLHILRNSIDHGIESPAERSRLGKPPRAIINLTVSQVNGNKVAMVISDDGAGVDAQGVKASAVKHHLLSDVQARDLDNEQAIQFVFHSEVSTTPILNAISGRGLGMAIVRAKAEKLGGQVFIESKQSVGTTLRLVLPATIANFRGILVLAAGQMFVLPSINVERGIRIYPRDIHTAENREIITLNGLAVSLVRLDAILNLPPKPQHTEDSAAIPAILVRCDGQQIVLVVDEILREEEVLVKPFRKPLVRIRNVSGATLLSSGKAVPVLNVADLLKSSRDYGAPPVQVGNVVEKLKLPRKKVLVVEDSITSRMLIKGILESAGYQVRVAVDGIDAFATLREDAFDLVVSDVEMPRMNGFDLASKIRADKRLNNMPVILVTALEKPEERERGIDSGANAYVVKSSFSQSNLLEVVRRLI